MPRSKVVSGVTLLVLVLVLAGMAVYGFRAATAPLPGLGAATSVEDCSEEELQVQRFITRSDVQVSVFNAGNRSGQAGRSLDRLEDAGFVAGNAGNAPDGVRVGRAVVWTTEEDDTAARLVARSIGRRIAVEVVPDDLGPGVDVLVGNGFRGLDRDAPRRLRLEEPIERCIDIG
jgi:hypothetical protein